MRRAFSLVELLVVMGVVSALISLLLPALRRVRLNAEATRCASQLRQVGLGLQLYAIQNRGWLPEWSGRHLYGGDGSAPDAPGLGWTEQLERMVGHPDRGVYQCPSTPEDGAGSPYFHYFMTGRFAHSEARRSMQMSEIRLSSNFVLGGECTHPSFNVPGRTWDDADKDDATFKLLLFENEPGGINIHPQGNFVLFADGHVQAFRRDDSSYLTWHPSAIRSWESMVLP